MAGLVIKPLHYCDLLCILFGRLMVNRITLMVDKITSNQLVWNLTRFLVYVYFFFKSGLPGSHYIHYFSSCCYDKLKQTLYFVDVVNLFGSQTCVKDARSLLLYVDLLNVS